MKKFYEAPELEIVAFEASEDITVLSSLVDTTERPNKDNEISSGTWN